MPMPTQISVWDPMIRIFHWLLVIAFFTAYIIEDHILWLHVWSGYLITALIMLRLLWGLIGPHHARFDNFLQRPSLIVANLKDVFQLRAKRYTGHSPAGGAMIIALLTLLMATTITGMVVYAGEKSAGPLWFYVHTWSNHTIEIYEDVHEVLSNITLGFIVVHIAAVLLLSGLHKEHLTLSMLTGKKKETASES